MKPVERKSLKRMTRVQSVAEIFYGLTRRVVYAVAYILLNEDVYTLNKIRVNKKLLSLSFFPSSQHMKICLQLLGLLCVLARISSAQADNIAFFYALDKDLESFKIQAQPLGQPLKVGTHVIPIFQLGAHRVYAVKMGSGAVETTASAQALLARIQCDEGFSVGPVGGLADKLKIGSWHRVSQVMCYQKGSWNQAGFQMAANAILNLKVEGTNSFLLPQLFRTNDTIKVASGEIFVTSDSYRSQLHDSTGADAVDMNLFGLVTVCDEYHLPLVCWRVVSDHANDHASGDFLKFTNQYDGAGGRAIAEIIREIPANPNSPDAYPNLKKILSGQR
jgi:nucleoside phosphorylase